MRSRPVVLLVLPLLFLGGLIILELTAFKERDPFQVIDDETAARKMAVDLSKELVKLFITIATATIGAAAYYLRTRLKGFEELPRSSLTYLILCLLMAVLSIYFGHLHFTTLRNQLAFGGYDPTTAPMVWTERLQFATLVLSLGWFGLLVVERETSRTPSPDED